MNVVDFTQVRTEKALIAVVVEYFGEDSVLMSETRRLLGEGHKPEDIAASLISLAKEVWADEDSN